MAISNLQEPTKSNVSAIYYQIFNKIIPKIYDICSKFWNQLSGVAAYAVITRIGKRYCPYLVRWHWTFLLIIGMVEQIFIYFLYRAYYFQTFVLIPQTQSELYINSMDSNLILQINLLNVVIACVVLSHIGFIIFGLFHAIWGQYFYFPFFVENTELHIGPRPKNSIYSGGKTSWQDPEEKNVNRLFPKLWFGWFGQKSQSNFQFVTVATRLIKKLLKKLKKQFKR
jgi:glucan phosphoethanolaminetransferase (alkaline phosphatase superfamily)